MSDVKICGRIHLKNEKRARAATAASQPQLPSCRIYSEKEIQVVQVITHIFFRVDFPSHFLFFLCLSRLTLWN